MNEFLLPPGELAQGFLASYFKIFCVIHEIHKKARVIPRERWLSTALSTARSTVRSTVGSTARSPGRSAFGAVGRVVTWVRTIPEGRGSARPGLHGRRAGMPHTQRGPSTYEVEGPRRGHRAGPPITRLPGHSPAAPPGRENQPGVPVSRRSARPPRRSSFPVRRSAGVELISILGGAEFLPLGAEQCKDFWPIIYGFHGYEQLFHTGGLVIPRAGPLSTGSSTTRSTGRPGTATLAGRIGGGGDQLAGCGWGSGRSPPAGAGESPGTDPLGPSGVAAGARRRSRLPSRARPSAPAGGRVTRAGS